MENFDDALKGIRSDYDSAKLSESGLPAQPHMLLKTWLSEAMESGSGEPNAFTLATQGEQYPDCRIVLLRTLEDKGFSFFTNYTSKKARDMNRHPFVTANFFWIELQRQVRITGKVEKLSTEQSDEYFATRPRKSQLGAWASNQSEVLNNRIELEERFKEIEKQYEGKTVPRPDFWGGYLIKPSYYEFWQGRPSRLHDRIAYSLENNKWEMFRLSP